MTCASCRLPILPGQDYEVIDKPSGSGCGTTLHIHRPCPTRHRLPSAPVHTTQRGRTRPHPGATSTQEET